MLWCDPWPLEVVIVAMMKRAARRPGNADDLGEYHEAMRIWFGVFELAVQRVLRYIYRSED